MFMPPPWNNGYHVNGNTYGTWLRGDPRGFRTRWGREQVDGDYRNPPAPGTYDGLHKKSEQLLKNAAVHLNRDQRKIAGDALVAKLLGSGIELLALSVDDHHYHLLARFPDHRPRHWVGLAKKHSSHILSHFGLRGTVWAKKCRCLPIEYRPHQLNVIEYITTKQGPHATVWHFRMPPPT